MRERKKASEGGNATEALLTKRRSEKSSTGPLLRHIRKEVSMQTRSAMRWLLVSRSKCR
jgi:hypothetical protein